jgi:hypothetical protein
MIDRIEINYMIMIKFFFILFLIDNFELFIRLRNFFIKIQKECNFDNLYILYYKLKYIEEKLSSENTNAQQFYTSVYDYLVYKLYLHIQKIVEPHILSIILDFELKYTFVDALIEKQLSEESNYKLKEQASVANNIQKTQHNFRQQSSLSSHHSPQYNSPLQQNNPPPPQYNSLPPQYNSLPPSYNSRQQLSFYPPPPPYNSVSPQYNSLPPSYNSRQQYYPPPPYEGINQFPTLNFRRKNNLPPPYSSFYNSQILQFRPKQ